MIALFPIVYARSLMSWEMACILFDDAGAGTQERWSVMCWSNNVCYSSLGSLEPQLNNMQQKQWDLQWLQCTSTVNNRGHLCDHSLLPKQGCSDLAFSNVLTVPVPSGTDICHALISNPLQSKQYKSAPPSILHPHLPIWLRGVLNCAG